MHNPGDSGAVGSLTLLREVGGPVHMQDKPHLVLPRCTYVYLSEVWSSIKWVGPTLSPRVSVSAHYWNCIQSISQVLVNYVCNFSSQTGWRRSCKLHQKVKRLAPFRQLAEEMFSSSQLMARTSTAESIKEAPFLPHFFFNLILLKLFIVIDANKNE